MTTPLETLNRKHVVPPTIGDKLATYQARRVHVTQMKEPLVKTLYWNRVAQAQLNLLAEIRPYPSEYSHLIADCEDEIAYARAARRKILTHLWACRSWAAGRKVA